MEQKKDRKRNSHNRIEDKSNTLRYCAYTQTELSEYLEEFQISRSQSGVYRILKYVGYTRKRLVLVPEEGNEISKIDARQNYVCGIQFLQNDNLVFLEETEINLNHTTHYGYSPNNMKAVKVIEGSRGKNICSMVAIIMWV